MTRMNAKNTWLWMVAAVALFAFIFFYERHTQKPQHGPRKILSDFHTNEINSVQVFPKGQKPIRAERTNGTWRLTEPVDYPAETFRIEALLMVFDLLTAPAISGKDIKNLPNADQQFGFDPPQASLVLGHKNHHILVGNKTAPGDQLFLQVVGSEDVYVVNAELMQLIPRTADDWRDKALVNWDALEFDRIIVTNAGKILELQHNPTNRQWRMSVPMDTRADSTKIESSLEQLPHLVVRDFLSDTPGIDLEPYGLENPELSLTFLQSTNTVLLLEFGKSPTNNADIVFARRMGQNTIVSVPKKPVEPWLASRSDHFRDFLDRHLLAVDDFECIDVNGKDNFTLTRETNNTWRVVPQDYVADPALMEQFIFNLTNLQALEIVGDNVTEPDLPKYGLAPPSLRYVLRSAATNGTATTTNCILEFGTQDGRFFARRASEGFVYAIDSANMSSLPKASLEMRDRRIWQFASSDVARITIRQRGKTRELIHKGNKNWTLAPGSQGIMDEITSAAIEETVLRLGDLAASVWVQCGQPAPETYGFVETDYQLTLELNNGEKRTVIFGKDAPSLFPYASVVVGGQTCVFEFPLAVYQYVQMWLTIPSYVP